MVNRNLIINADDFGMSDEVNRAVLYAFQSGLVSTASLMVNMSGFVAACELARRFALTSRLGLHLNLSEGYPLTRAIRRCVRFCDERGEFRPRSLVWWLSAGEREAIEDEFACQITRCMREGILPSHLDSHHHYHTEWPIGSISIRLARKYGIQRVRLSRNCGSNLGMVKRLYKLAFNMRLRHNLLTPAGHFGSAEDASNLVASSKFLEIMVHPRINPTGLLTDMESGPELDKVVTKFLSPN